MYRSLSLSFAHPSLYIPPFMCVLREIPSPLSLAVSFLFIRLYVSLKMTLCFSLNPPLLVLLPLPCRVAVKHGDCQIPITRSTRR